jgi:phosphinothricin acetyltransferase
MIAIRPALADDADAIVAIYAPHVRDGTVSFETAVPGTVAMRARMTASDGLYPWIVATSDNAVLGYAYAGRFRERAAYRWAVETTIYVAAAAQGAGVGRQLYAALIATLRAQGFTQAIGIVALPNPKSVRLHEASGFRSAGVFRRVGHKNGCWIDVSHWQCALAPPENPPAEPRRFAAVGVVRGGA